MNLDGKSLKSSFIRYIIPSILAQWVYSLYSMVDGMFVAKGVNEIALTAVNLSYPFVAFLFAISLLFAVGASTIVSILLGENHHQRACEEFTQNSVLQVISSLVIALLVMLNRESFARFLGAPNQQTADYVIQYITWIAPFSCVYLLSYSFEILLKTDGYPKKATLIVILGAVENCILDWFFVMVLHKGIQGAALATSLSQATVIILYLHHFLSGKGVLSFKRFKPDFGILVRQVRNGFSSGVTEMSSGMVTFLFNQVILMYLTQDALVSYTIISYVNNIVVLSATGIAQGAQPLISYYYGQKSLDKCKSLFRYSLVAAGVVCTVSFAVCFILARGIVDIFIGPELQTLRDSSVTAFRIFAASFLLVGFNIAVSGYFTSVERAAEALVISAGRGLVLMAGCLIVMTGIFGGAGIWWSPLVSETACLAVTGLLLLIYCRKDAFWNQKERFEVFRTPKSAVR